MVVDSCSWMDTSVRLTPDFSSSIASLFYSYEKTSTNLHITNMVLRHFSFSRVVTIACPSTFEEPYIIQPCSVSFESSNHVPIIITLGMCFLML